jgi:uncharacterized protein YjbI with pentapeptide repeats
MDDHAQRIEIIDKRSPKQKLVVKNSDISDSEFQDCRAERVTFHDISLPFVKVTYADLKHCHFEDMNMVNGKIGDANLTNLEINGANISGIAIRNAGANEPVTLENLNIPNSTFTDCNLANVEFVNCNIEGLKINGIPIGELLAKAGVGREE